MPINYDVKANIVDIRGDQPHRDDQFLVDTNVWYWHTYTRASVSARNYQISNYPAYISKVLKAKGKLCYCGLSLSELARNIEKTEKTVYETTQQLSEIPPKEFRHNLPQQRQTVVNAVTSACMLVRSQSTILPIGIDDTMIDNMLTQISTLALDGYDILIYETMRLNNVTAIITDDGDFATVDGITVFTSNQTVLNLAQQAGKLLTR